MSMKSTVIPEAEMLDDARLVELGRDGNREAFGQLVGRYQSPVCALAYSACGNIPQSEDLAQETFIVAWRSLGNLKEPSKFKSWLYGIARNLILTAFRKQSRNPLTGAEPLDEALPLPALVASPAGQAISREEQEILWRALEQIPETYREPLVLFYRENESIARVAEIMGVSEEAARQRLSRGRKLLQEQVQSFVEGALRQTVPGPAFTASVMAALPVMQLATGSAVSSSAMGGAAGKTTSVGLMMLFKGLLIKFLPGLVVSYIMVQKVPESSRERKFLWKAWGVLFVMAFLFPAVIYLCGYIGKSYWDAHPQASTWVILSSAFGFVGVIGPYTFWMARTQRKIQKEEAAMSGRAFSMSQPYEYRSKATFLGLPLVHSCFNVRKNGRIVPAVGWVAFGERAYGLVAFGAVAVGGISMGAVAIGPVGVGGFGFGAFAFGGFAIGWWAMGGAAIGYLAYGGGAIGWLGASGGAVLARHFATGGGAIAAHGNDTAAYAFMRENYFFRHVTLVFDVLIIATWILPATNLLIFKWRRERAAKLQGKLTN